MVLCIFFKNFTSGSRTNWLRCGGDAIPDTDASSLFHFPHHCETDPAVNAQHYGNDQAVNPQRHGNDQAVNPQHYGNDPAVNPQHYGNDQFWE